MKRNLLTALLMLSVVIILNGCAHVISKGLRERVASGITFKEVRENPDAYRGKIVLWGGVIVRSENLKEGTLIEILQISLNRGGGPKNRDVSEGRFLALYPAFLDTVIYCEGREVTVAGEIQGKRVRSLGEIEYTYPLLLVKEIHLWELEKPAREPRIYLGIGFEKGF